MISKRAHYQKERRRKNHLTDYHHRGKRWSFLAGPLLPKYINQQQSLDNLEQPTSPYHTIPHHSPSRALECRQRWRGQRHSFRTLSRSHHRPNSNQRPIGCPVAANTRYFIRYTCLARFSLFPTDSIVNLPPTVAMSMVASNHVPSRHKPVQLKGTDGACPIIQPCPVNLLFLKKKWSISMSLIANIMTLWISAAFSCAGCWPCGLLRTGGLLKEAEPRIRGRKSDASMANQMQWWVKFCTDIEKIGPKCEH